MPHKMTYYEKISLKHKTPEEASEILKRFEDNINLANRVAQKYYRTKYWDYDEALQIARMGLWKACLIWDPNQYRLSTLAYNIINRDFIDFDKQQKRQPYILFNLEDNVVTNDLSLSDVLVDMDGDIEQKKIDKDNLDDLNQNIVYVLDDVAEQFNLPSGIAKLIYLVYIESLQGNEMNLRVIDFLPKQVVKDFISEFQYKLSENL